MKKFDNITNNGIILFFTILIFMSSFLQVNQINGFAAVRKKAATMNSASVYNKALSAVKEAEGSFKYNMSKVDNINYAKIKYDAAKSKVEEVSDKAANAYLSTRLSVVENKLNLVNEAYKKNNNSAKIDGTCRSAVSINNNTVVVSCSAIQMNVSPSDFVFDNGLTAVNASVKQDDNKAVIIKTTSQDPAKTYKLSYKGNDTGLTIKGQDAVTTPCSIAFTSRSFNAAVGTNVNLTASVTPAAANVPVCFNIMSKDPALMSINPVIIKEILTNDKGIAELNYTRFYGGDDQIRVYPTGSPSIGDTASAFWGNAARMTIKKLTADSVNGGTINYSVTLKDNNGCNVSNRYLNVIFKENINAFGTSAMAINPQNGGQVTLFQRDDVGQQKILSALTIKTDVNGVACFTVTGTNTTATPIVYDTGLNSTDANNQIMLAQDTKMNDSCMQVQGEPAVFKQNDYTIIIHSDTSSTVSGDVASWISPGAEFSYSVQVKDANGAPFSNGKIHVGFKENVLGTGNTSASISKYQNDKGLKKDVDLTDDPLLLQARSLTPPISIAKNGSGQATAVTLNLNEDGIATIFLSDDRPNDAATPFVWIDQSDEASNYVASDISYSSNSAVFKLGTASMNFPYFEYENAAGSSMETAGINSTMYLKLKLYTKLYKSSSISYTVKNTGNHDVWLTATNLNNKSGSSGFKNTNIYYNGVNNISYTEGKGGYRLSFGQSVTIKGETESDSTYEVYIAAYAEEETTISLNGEFQVSGDKTYSALEVPLSFVEDKAPADVAGQYTGTVTDIAYNRGVYAYKANNGDDISYIGEIRIKTNAGYYITLPVRINDTVLEGVDKSFSDGAFNSISLSQFAHKLSVGDQIFVVFDKSTKDSSSNWKFVNVDNSNELAGGDWQLPVTGLFVPSDTVDNLVTLTRAISKGEQVYFGIGVQDSTVLMGYSLKYVILKAGDTDTATTFDASDTDLSKQVEHIVKAYNMAKAASPNYAFFTVTGSGANITIDGYYPDWRGVNVTVVRK